MSDAFEMIKQTYKNYRRDQGVRLAAAITFLAMLSLIPITIFFIMIGQALLGEATLQNEVIPQVQSWFGENAAQAMQQAFQSAAEVQSSTLPAILSLVLLGYSASTVFYELQKALNKVWGVEEDPENTDLSDVVRKRIFSFFLVLVLGVLLVLLIVLSGVLWGVQQSLDSAAGGFAIGLVNFLVAVGIVWAMLSLIYKFIPEVDVSWRVVLPSAFIAALLYVLGLEVLKLYLSTSTTASVYRSLGSVAILLIWLFYSAQVMFLGAEFTRVFADFKGEQVEVNRGTKIIDEARLPSV